jgi:hypothetical protein
MVIGEMPLRRLKLSIYENVMPREEEEVSQIISATHSTMQCINTLKHEVHAHNFLKIQFFCHVKHKASPLQKPDV